MNYLRTTISVCLMGLAFLSCSDSHEKNDFSLLSISPLQAMPGETVTLSGTSFKPGMQICFGDGMQMCTGVLVTSSNTGTAIVPAGSGTNLPVRVVMPDGSSQGTVIQFGYVNSGSGNGNGSGNGSGNISWKQDDHEVISNDPKIDRMSPTGGSVGVTVTIAGANLGMANQVCFGESCVNVTPSADKIVVSVPDGSGNVTVRVTGPNWSIKAGEFSYIGLNTQSINVDAPQMVEWCRLNYVPPTPQLGEVATSYAEVFKDGCTPDSTSRCPGMKGQIGFIADNSPDRWDQDKWTWVDARQNPMFSHDNGNLNDEYMGDLSNLGEGIYRVAFRFSMDGTNWTYCDYDSSSNGFYVEEAGAMAVSSTKPLSIEWCRIVNGETYLASYVNEASEAIYAQFFVNNGCTKDRAKCPNLVAQIGYGSPYTSWDLNHEYHWRDATFNAFYDGSGGKDHNEYMGTVSTSAEGEYAILFRGSVDGGKTWTYCDTSDNNSFSTDDSIKWYVAAAYSPQGEEYEYNDYYEQGYEYYGDGKWCNYSMPDYQYPCVYEDWAPAIKRCSQYWSNHYKRPKNEDLDWCIIQYPKSFKNGYEDNWTDWDNDIYSNSGTRGIPRNYYNIYGRVHMRECTDYRVITAEFGYSVLDKDNNRDMSDHKSGWTWQRAELNENADAGENLEYKGSVYSLKTGYSGYEKMYYLFRFSVDNGRTWRYCDTEGNADFDRNKIGVYYNQ